MDRVSEVNSSPENLRSTENAWIFDVDGTITDPEQKIFHPQILDAIIKLLEKGEPVAFNTGRSLPWLIERIIEPLREKTKNNSIFSRLIVIAEKGGTRLTFDENGQMQESSEESIKIPPNLINEVKNLIEDRFSETMFFDDTKKTMISVEMKDGISPETYRPYQQSIVLKLEDILARNNLTENFTLDTSSIAVDIQISRVGKGLGAKKVLNWLVQMGLRPAQFITFGDSKGDTEMPQEIEKHGHKVIFVFVGEEELPKDLSFEIIRTQSLHDQGTLEYLQSLKIHTSYFVVLNLYLNYVFSLRRGHSFPS